MTFLSPILTSKELPADDFLCNPDSIPDEEKTAKNSPSKMFLHWGIITSSNPAGDFSLITHKSACIGEIRQFGVRNDHSNHRFQAAAGLQRTPLSSWVETTSRGTDFTQQTTDFPLRGWKAANSASSLVSWVRKKSYMFI